MLMIVQAVLRGVRGLQDQLRVRKKEPPFLGERDAFARSAEKLYAQFFFQRLNLMADCGLGYLQSL